MQRRREGESWGEREEECERRREEEEEEELSARISETRQDGHKSDLTNKSAKPKKKKKVKTAKVVKTFVRRK